MTNALLDWTPHATLYFDPSHRAVAGRAAARRLRGPQRRCVSSLGEDDDAFCRANDVVAGSSEYVACRKNRDVQRSNAAANADRAQRNLSETMINTPYKP